MKNYLGLLGCSTPFLLIIASIAAWFQHIYTCLTTEAYTLLVAGAIFAPIGVLHGFAIWLGIV